MVATVYRVTSSRQLSPFARRALRGLVLEMEDPRGNVHSIAVAYAAVMAEIDNGNRAAWSEIRSLVAARLEGKAEAMIIEATKRYLDIRSLTHI